MSYSNNLIFDDGVSFETHISEEDELFLTMLDIDEMEITLSDLLIINSGGTNLLTDVAKYTDNSYTYFSGNTPSGWQVNRWDVNTSKTIATGTGTKPASLAECQALSYS